MSTRPFEARASEIAAGDTVTEFGLEPYTVKTLGHHGDHVLITTTDDVELSLDSDSVVEIQRV